MDENAEVTLVEDDEERSNHQTDQNSTDAGVTYEDNFEAASIELTTEIDQNESAQENQDKDGEQEDEMAKITKTTPKQKSSELDKFKRRLIRAIARLMRNDQTPTDEIWEELKKQSGCDCKLLWNRMRTLTMKKLRRLFTAEDKIGNITKIAQLTVTDWLLFDLVLVHEKIDVIGKELQDQEAEESPKILEDLFATVVVFDLERLKGDKLTKAWFEATTYYNGKDRQCSPMLLQRRWYQMKETVREKFYQFWFQYRGTQRQLAAANEFKPTGLEMEIVKLFKYITTEPLPTWEELIQQKKVALPEDFERLQLAKRRIFRTETGPDLEVIEPQVETIDLDQESNSDESRDYTSAEPKTNVDLAVVKAEKVDEISDDDEDVRILESVHIPLETDPNAETESSLRNSTEDIVEEQRSTDINNAEDISIVNENTSPIDSIQLSNVTTIKNENEDVNTQSIDIQDETDDIVESIDDGDMLMPTIVASTSIANISSEFDGVIIPEISNVSSAAILTDEPMDNAVSNEINGILESVAENISTKNLFNVPQRTNKTLPTQDILQNPDKLVKNIIDEELSSIKNNIKDEKSLDPISAVPNDVNIFDGIELEDDGIEYVEEEEDHMKDVKPKLEIKIEKTDESDCANTPTIDLKLLLTPVVYTKKLDDMDVFRFIDYNTVKDKRVIDNADLESKPVDRNSVKMEEISQERPPTPDSECYSDTSEYHSEIDVRPETVSPSSWLLNKLQKLSYNPIQLCKNPDFNTRLKRLSAGFFSSERNRRQLKECKPLTIDLHKSFETKLVNNTLYLTRTKLIENKTHELERNAVGTAVFPTTLPLQNLVDNVISDILGSNIRNEDHGRVQNTQIIEVPSDDDILGSAPTPDSSLAKNFAGHSAALDSYPSERNKVINLPDLAQIRRLNERLLTAEVSPIQVTNTAKVPVNIVPIQQGSDIATPTNKILQSNDDIINKSIESTVSSALSDINCEASSILSKTNLTYDARCQNDNIIDATQKALPLDSNNSTQFNTVPKGNALNRINNLQQKVVKEPKKPARVNRVEVSWNPPPKKMIIPHDRLLTSDTVDKIINICKGDDSWLKNSKAYKKALRKKTLREQEKKEMSSSSNKEVNQSANKIDNEVSCVHEFEAPIENKIKNTDLKSVPIQMTNEIKNRNKGNIKKQRMKGDKYCCWAREKIIKLNIGQRAVTRHRCPRPLCNCCCRQELVEKMFEINVKREQERSQMSEAEINKIKKKIKINFPRPADENSTQGQLAPKVSTTEPALKVSIGINTDFDADFETGFAANLAEFNTSSKFFDSGNPSVSTVKVTYGPNETQANCQTQTSVNLMVLDKNNKNQTFPCKNTSQNASDENASTLSFNESNSCNSIPTTNPIVLNKRNSTFLFKESISSNGSPVKIRLVSDINDSAKLKKTNLFNVVSKLKPSGLDKNKIFFPLSGSNVAGNNLVTNHSQLSALLFDKGPSKIAPNKLMSRTPSPLSRGGSKVVLEEKSEPLDKILFLTNDKSKNTRMPICLGKNKILLCSFEKPQLKNQPKLDDNPVVSASQDTLPIVALPDGVRIVLMPNKELALSIEPGVELDSSQLAYLPTLMASIQKQLDEVGNIASSHMDELNNSISNDQNNITLEKLNESKLKSVDKEIENETTLAVTSLTCNKLIDHADDMENDINKTKEGDCDNKKEDSCMLDKNNANAVDIRDDSDTNKKTILSDLMEMSGISAEDTHLTSPTKQQSVLCSPPLIQGLQSQIANQHNAKFMNNPLFNNPVVRTALNRCPELCIVFSYTELRYASENNAQFFKMDIETGVIVPINLVLKKQVQGEKSNKQFTISKSVIDLTDDPEEDEPMSIEEQNVQTLEPQSTAQQVNHRVVPVKLFSTRPSLLRRGKSLLLKSFTDPSSGIKKKKMIRIIQVNKRKRKQSMECVASIDLDSDTEQTESTTAVTNSEAIHEKTKSDGVSDSDDEPLAFKAKRMKDSTQELTEPTDQLNRNTDDQEEKQDTEMVRGNAEEMTQMEDENQVDDPTKNIPDGTYDHVNPTSQLEPVVFEPLDFGDNNQESSEEDCILGV